MSWMKNNNSMKCFFFFCLGLNLFFQAFYIFTHRGRDSNCFRANQGTQPELLGHTGAPGPICCLKLIKQLERDRD